MIRKKIHFKDLFFNDDLLSIDTLMVFVILFLCPSILMAQYTPKEIDSLMTTEYYRLREERKFQEIIQLSKLVIRDAKKQNYIKGEVYGFARLGNMQFNIRCYKEALESLNYANQLVEKYKIDDNTIKSSIHLGIGLCYSESGSTYSNAEQEFQKALFFAQKIENKYERSFYLYLVYSNSYGLYSNFKNTEKEVYYLRKALSVKKDSYMLTEMARYHNLYSKNKDSARFYLEESEKLASTDFDKSALYNQWGKYYEANKEYKKAIEFYKKNEALAIKTKEAPLQEDALMGLYFCNEKLGNLEEAVYYSEKRNQLKDSIQMLKVRNSEMAISDIVNKNENTMKQQFSVTQKIFIGFVFIALMILLFFGIKIYSNKKEAYKTQKLIQEKEIEIKEKETLAENLQLKINDSFDELINLAKSNSPEFFTRFKEVYPEKIDALLAINDKLRVTELTLCAYIFLGFKTKDIALFTFKSINTIRNRKYNLRKKLFIEEDQDMEIWFKKL